MRMLALSLALLLPIQVFAADVGKRGPFLPSPPRLAKPVIPAALAAPRAPIAAAPAAGPGAKASVPQRVAAIGAKVAADAAAASSGSGEAASSSSEEHLRLLQGGEADGRAAFVAAPQGGGPSAPLPPAGSDKKAAVRMMIGGSMGFKLGMEAMTTSIPFVAMASLGGATAVALLTVAVYGVAQALAGSWAGSLADRLPARKLLGAAVVAQAGLVATTVALGLTGLLSAWTLYPLYAVVGVVVGTAETARRLIPALVFGQDEGALRTYNAKIHLFYEIAGVSGAMLTAGVTFGAAWLAKAGYLGSLASLPAIAPLMAMALSPLALLAGGLMFWRARHARPAAPSAGSAGEAGPSASLLDGLRLIFRDARLTAAAVAMLLPWIIHRVFEHLVAPMYAKQGLAEPAFSGFLIAASNLGELFGALLLLRLTALFPGPYRWVRWGAYGVVGAWALTAAMAAGLTGWAALGLVLPLVLVFSMTWAGSHVSLETEVQKRVDPRLQPRVFGLLFGAYVIGAALSSLGAGWLIDSLGLQTGVLVITALFSLVGLAAFWASRKLKS